MYMHDHLDRIYPITAKILFESHASVERVNIAEGWTNAPDGFLRFGDTLLSVGYNPTSSPGVDSSWQEQIDPDGTSRWYEFNKRGDVYDAAQRDEGTGNVIKEFGDNPEDNEAKFALLHMLYVAFTQFPEQQAETLPAASS